jgi:hypothetical protein
MVRAILLSVVMLSVTLSLFAEDVTLSGTVKKTGAAAGLSGVNVSLAKVPSLSATTDADGKFIITGSTSLWTQPKQVPSFQFNLKGDRIIFSPVSGNAPGRIELFSSNGRKIFSAQLVSGQERRRSITLPELGSGINIMQITIGTTTLTRTLMRVANELFMKEGSPAGTGAGAITLQKQAVAAVVDTLIATKSGFIPKKVPIDVYTKSNITIEIEPEDDYSGSITNLSVRANPNSVLSAYVSWTTEKAATSKVQFGVGGVQWEIAHKEATTEHEVLVIGMRAKTKYQIRAISGKAQADTSYTTGTLPAHIPEGSVKSSAGSVDGWTLVNVLRGTGGIIPRSNYPAAAVMYDHDGRVVWYRVHGTIADLGGCTSTEFIEKDNTVIVGATDKEPPREYDLAGNILWEGPSPIVPNTYAITHHASKMSNGHYLLVGWGEKEQVGAPAPGSFGVDSLTWANLREVTLDNKVVWEWHLKDFITVPASAKDDYFHANSATVFPERDEVYFDCRWIGLIKTTYKNPTLIYRIPASYNSASPTDMSFNPPQSQFSDVHDPEIHLDDSTVMFFDNGGYDANMMFNPNGKYNFHSRVVEYKIDETGKKASLKWEFPGTINNNSFFKDTFYMPYWGDADRLDNDNVLFTASVMGSGKVSHIVEVTRAGEVVWDFTLPADNGMYRAQRIPTPPLVRPIGE